MLDWYLTVLQAEVTFANASIAFLSYDEQNRPRRTGGSTGDVPRQPNSAGLDHLAFTYADEGELVATYERLKGVSIAPSRAIDHGSSTSLYYLDPDGNQIELKVDSFNTLEEQFEYMRPEEFARNPLGTPFDPDEWAAGYPAPNPGADVPTNPQ